jgi:hypothetical protein
MASWDSWNGCRIGNYARQTLPEDMRWLVKQALRSDSRTGDWEWSSDIVTPCLRACSITQRPPAYGPAVLPSDPLPTGLQYCPVTPCLRAAVLPSDPLPTGLQYCPATPCLRACSIAQRPPAYGPAVLPWIPNIMCDVLTPIVSYPLPVNWEQTAAWKA